MSTRNRAMALTVASSLVAACSGQIVTQRVADPAMGDPESKIPGVIVYQPAMLAETSVMTAYVKDGKLVGRATDSPPACRQVPFEKVVVLPDLARPYVISYVPGIFETNKFGVTLNNGMLAAVNAQPTISPPSVPNVLPTGVSPLSAVANPVGIFVMDRPIEGDERLFSIALGDDLPVCNDGPVVLGHRRLNLP